MQQTQTTARRSKRPFVLALVLVVLVSAYTGYWYWAADFFRSTIARWIGEQAEKGTVVEYAALEIGGFPFELRATGTGVKISAQDGSTFETALMSVGARPWNPHVGTAIVPGPMTIASQQGGNSVAMTASSGGAEFRLAHNGQFRSGSFHTTGIAADIAAANGAAITITIDTLTATGEKFTPASGTDLAQHWRVEMTNLVSPDVSTADIQRMTIAVDQMGPLAEDKFTESTARAWAHNGGVLQLTELSVVAEPLSFTMDGTFTVDSMLRPEGAMSLHLRGLNPMIDGLVKGGQIAPNAAAGIQVMVGAFSTPQPDGSVLLAVTMQDGWLEVAGQRMTRVAPLVLPQ
jgi:hypothetical protein